MADFLQARGLWDNPAFMLSDEERGYVESVPLQEAVRMLREVGFFAHATGEMDLDAEDMDVAAFSTLSVSCIDAKFNPGEIIAQGYRDSEALGKITAKYGKEGVTA
jgi:hypothetical protein